MGAIVIDAGDIAALTEELKKGHRGGGRPPVDSKTRARVRKLAREGKTRNAVAKLVGISPSTVTRICADAKPPITFDRRATAAAVKAHAVDLKAARARLSVRAITEVERLLGLLTEEHEVIHWDKDGMMHRGHIDQPTSGDIKNYVTSIGILIDKHLVLVNADSDDTDLPAVDRWLAHLEGGA